MLVIVLSAVPPSTRGDISKWLFEVHPGVYVGSPSRQVGDKLWERIERSIGSGAAVMIRSDRSEQEYEIKTLNSGWKVVDFDGVKLMKRPVIKKSKNGASEAEKKSSDRNAPKKRFPQEFIVLDLETTGLDPLTDSILEIGALKISGDQIVDSFQTFISIEETVPENIRKLTGITDEMTAQGISEGEGLYYLEKFCDGKPLVGYNIDFDISFLIAAGNLYDLSLNVENPIDVLKYARKQLRVIENHKLSTVASHFGIKCETTHRALKDCEVILSVLEKMKKKILIEQTE